MKPRHAKEFDSYFAIVPDIHSGIGIFPMAGKKVFPDGFNYASNSNDKWLTIKELREIIKYP